MASTTRQNELWDAVCIINNYYEDLFRPVAADFGLTVNQLRVLYVLHRFGSLGVGELAVTVGMARTNASSLCKKLCKQGFLLRNRNGDGDERQVHVELTPEGNAAALQAQSRLCAAKPIATAATLDPLIAGLREIAAGLSLQGAQISRLARWKAKFTPAEDSRTSRVLHRAKTMFKRDPSKKERTHASRDTGSKAGTKTEKTLG